MNNMDQVPNQAPTQTPQALPLAPNQPSPLANHPPPLGLYQPPPPPSLYQHPPLVPNQPPPQEPNQPPLVPNEPPPLGLHQPPPEAPSHPPPQGPPQPNPGEHNSQPPPQAQPQPPSSAQPQPSPPQAQPQPPSSAQPQPSPPQAQPQPHSSAQPQPSPPQAQPQPSPPQAQPQHSPPQAQPQPSPPQTQPQPSPPQAQPQPSPPQAQPHPSPPQAQAQPSPPQAQPQPPSSAQPQPSSPTQPQPPPSAQSQPPPSAQSQPPPQAQNQPPPQAQNQPPPRAPPHRGSRRRRNHVMANPLVHVRDRLFYALFFKSALIYARIFPKPLRRLIEFLLLLSALSSFLILVYVHYIFSYKPASCLESIADTWPRDGIVRIQIVKEGAGMTDGIHVAYLYTQNSAKQKHESELSKKIKKVLDKIEFENAFTNIQPSPSDNLFSPERTKSKKRSVTNSSISSNYLSSNSPADVLLMKTDESYSISDDVKLLKLEEDGQNESYKASSYNYYEDVEDTEVPEEGSSKEANYIVEYSLEYGMLRLSPLTREKLNIPVMIVSLNPKSHACFGDAITRTILSEFLGYDDVLMSSAKALAEKEQNKGYLRNVITGEQFRFVTMWMSRSSYIAAFFVMLLFTVTISMLLRYSHHQIFVLIVDILQMLEFNLAGILPATPLLTVIMALIGMEAIMSEFFNDTTTAFYIILIVWTADQYDAVFCHTYISKKYWARFFFLYHYHFYAYHYRFNGQYSGLALVASFLFILHSMVYFFHHYELPEILQQAQIQEILLRDLRVLSQNHPHRLRRGFLVPRARVTVQEDPFDSENSFVGNDPDSENSPDNESNGTGSRLTNGLTLADAMDNISRQWGRTMRGPRVPLISDLRVLVTDFNDILVADRSTNVRNPSPSNSS